VSGHNDVFYHRSLAVNCYVEMSPVLRL
jgi:hypothetical protein